jgi:hypothetical protein
MKLSDFPYRTTNRLVKYAKLISKVITSFNRSNAFSIGTIAYDPFSGLLKKEDLLKYWDESSNDLTFGRYLLFTNNETKEVIPFWTGISSTFNKTIFCIWFNNTDPLAKYTVKLEEKFGSNFNNSGIEIWIHMKDADFEKFCNSNSCSHFRRQIVKKFLKSVLEVLK